MVGEPPLACTPCAIVLALLGIAKKLMETRVLYMFSYSLSCLDSMPGPMPQIRGPSQHIGLDEDHACVTTDLNFLINISKP
jgi:hypothetical protein